MNVVTANENREIIDRLTIDIIKRVDGSYEIKELLSKFVNLYFDKMIIDITSIKNYENEQVIISLAKVIEPSRIILLLNDNPIVNSNEYLSMLVQNGFYNFTRNYEGLDYLIRNPNTYDDVKNLIYTEDVEEVIQEEEFIESKPNAGRKVIGFINLTNHAGASTLVNMCTKCVNQKGKTAVGLEMFKQDLLYYRDPNIFSCMSKLEFEQKLRVYDGVDAIFVDLNDFSSFDNFDKVVYLIEPSFIALTKLLRKNKNIFVESQGECIVLNKSFITEKELKEFEYEFRTKIFAILPPLNDRANNNDEISKFLEKLGIKLK